jgi:signal transduction histidine kinase
LTDDPRPAPSGDLPAFERAISANEVSGLGLELFISRSIVESHGGSIRVETGPSGGATFVVELPLADPAHA